MPADTDIPVLADPVKDHQPIIPPAPTTYPDAVVAGTGRFWAKVAVSGPDVCWEWTGARSWKNYGRFWIDGRMVQAHRFSYELVNGPLDEAAILRHKCDNPSCVNPNHLEPGTHLDNVLDMIGRGRKVVQRGEEASNVVLTEQQVHRIRAMWLNVTRSREMISRTLQVPQTQVTSALYYWKHLPWPEPTDRSTRTTGDAA